MGCTAVCQKLFSKTQNKGTQNRKRHQSKYTAEGSTAKGLVDNLHQIQNTQEAFLQQIDLKIKHRITNEEIIRKYKKSKGNQLQLYQILSQDITNFYIELTQKYLQLINNQKITQTQLKVQFSQQVLLLSLEIFKVMGSKKKYVYSTESFQKFNQIQGKLIGYLKMKYPRAGNVFVPGDFVDKFKQFDMSNLYQNDILKNAHILFKNSSKIQVINKLKQFFNKIIQQLDKKFPIFKKLLQQKVFIYTEDGVTKTLNYKIGRKLPQNIARFEVDNSQQLTINSPQLFRTIIKWIQVLQKQASIPQQTIKKKSTLKIYKLKNKNTPEEKYQEQVVHVEQVQQLVSSLIQNYVSFNQSYKIQLKQLKQELGVFNASLLKIMFTSERKQKFVPESEANVIKYALYNTKVVSWMVVQMLVFLIQKLIQVGQAILFNGRLVNIDLVTFSVMDLMRSMVVGTKKQIMAVYINMLNLEKSGQLKIIKIKNRLGTLLKDAMIIFTIKGSFIICQLQLVLSQGQNVSDRQKNTQFLNHFLYQLQRSPYGVLSETAVILGFKDSKVGYAPKIGYYRGQSFMYCQTNHSQSISRQLVQKKPIICITCSEFYNSFQNMFPFKKCQKCNIFQCCMCSFAKDKDTMRQEVHKKFQVQFQRCIFSNRQPNIFIMIFINKLLIEEKLQLSEVCKFLGKSKLSGKQLRKFIIQKKYMQIIKSQQLQRQNQMIFILVQFKSSLTKIRQFYWNKQLEEFQNCFNAFQLMSDMKTVNISQYDFVLFYQTQKMVSISAKSQEKQQMVFLTLQNISKVQNIQRFYLVPIFASFAFLMRFQTNNDKNIEGLKVSSQTIAKKKRFTQNSLLELRKNLPNLKIVQQNFIMPNYGLTSNLLFNFFEEISVPQKQNIKEVNLSDNIISDASILFVHCPNLKSIILSKNFIKSLNLKQSTSKSLQTLILSNNLLTDLANLRQLSSLKKLKINNNQLISLQMLNLVNLQQLDISNNKLDTLVWLQKSSLPNLKILQASNSGISETLQHSTQSLTFSFPKLIQFGYNQNATGFLNIKSFLLQYLSADKCKLKRLYIPLMHIIYLNISNNNIQNLDDILSVNMPNARTIKCKNAGNLPILPKINADKLIQFQISNCKISNAKQLGNSNMKNIEQINLSFNYDIEKIPQINFPNLKKFNTQGLRLKNINFLQKSDLQKLEELKLNGESYSKKVNDLRMFNIIKDQDQQNFPNFRMQTLKTLQLTNFTFKTIENITSSHLPNLKNLALQKINLKLLSKFNLKKLQNLKLHQLQCASSQQIQQSEIPQLKTLSLDSSNIKMFKMIERMQKLQRLQCKNQLVATLQVMKLTSLQSISLNNCRLIDINPFMTSNLPNLTQIDFSLNNIQNLPSFQFQNLVKVKLAQNRIFNLSNFANSSSNKIQYLDLSQNNITHLPSIKNLKLKYLKLDFNPLQDLEELSGFNLQYIHQFKIIGLKNLKNISYPVLSLPKAKQVVIFSCNVQDLSNLSEWELPEVQQFIIGSSFPLKIPIFNFPRLQKFRCCYSEQLSPKQVQKSIENLMNYDNFQAQNIYFHRLKSIQSLAMKSKDDLSNLAQWDCINLKTIVVKNLCLSDFPKIQMIELEHLIISKCFLQNINQFKESVLPSLQNLVLYKVKGLDQLDISENIISGGKILIKENQIQKVSSFLDSKCKQIVLKSNKIKQLGVMHLNRTQILDISDNKLENIQFLQTASKLKILNLSYNNIRQLPNIEFPELTDFSISHNNLSRLFLDQKNYPKLQNIEFYANKIERIDKIQIRTILKFNGYQNNIKQIDYFQDLSDVNFSFIDLGDNKIQKISRIPKTKQLYLYLNPIKNLVWLNFNDTSILQTLIISSASIKDFRVFGGSRNKYDQLIKLDLHDNEADYFPANSSTFPKLQQLDLSNNKFLQISQFPSYNFPQLEKLYLNDNKLIQFRTCLTKLKYLYLNNNQLNKIEFPAYVLQIVREIQLDNNQLQNIDFMSSCPRLSKLSAKNNLIKSLPDISSNFSLKKLVVPFNPINNFQRFFQSKFDELDPIQFEYSTDPTLPDWVVEIIKKLIQQKVFENVKQINAQTQGQQKKQIENFNFAHALFGINI